MGNRVSLLLDCASVRNQRGHVGLMHHECVGPDDEVAEPLPGGVSVSVEIGRPSPVCTRCGEELPVKRVLPDE